MENFLINTMKFTNCLKCGKKVSKNCHLGYCNSCRNRSGGNNPFFGKKHDRDMIENTKVKLSKISKNNWNNEEYRNKVISGASKPRKESFKKEQSDRVKEWYKNNPNQKEFRSILMKKSWADGKIKPNINSINESKLEREFRAELKKILIGIKVIKTTIRIGKRWFYPDVKLRKRFLIEFYGDYWHANPKMFSSSDIIHHGLTAQQIWNVDIERKDFLEKNGYKVLTVYQTEWKEMKKHIIKIIKANL